MPVLIPWIGVVVDEVVAGDDVGGEIRMVIGDTGVDDADLHPAVSRDHVPRLGSVDVVVPRLLKRPEVAEAGIVGRLRRVDEKVRLRVADVGVRLEPAHGFLDRGSVWHPQQLAACEPQPPLSRRVRGAEAGRAVVTVDAVLEPHDDLPATKRCFGRVGDEMPGGTCPAALAAAETASVTPSSAPRPQTPRGTRAGHSL